MLKWVLMFSLLVRRPHAKFIFFAKGHCRVLSAMSLEIKLRTGLPNFAFRLKLFKHQI